MSEECKSCIGCKFLYGDGSGYSNYTWMDTQVTCALDKNPKLPVELPYDWEGNTDGGGKGQPEHDNLPATQQGRCESFAPGPFIVLDPDREGWPSDYSARFEPYGFEDDEQYSAIAHDDGWDKPLMDFAQYKTGRKP